MIDENLGRTCGLVKRPASWLMLVLVVLVGGCAASNVQIQPVLDNQTVLADGEGLLVVQVADTTPAGQVLPVSQLTLASRDVNAEEGKLPRIQAVEDFGRSTRLFMAVLPADEYAISSLRSYYQGYNASFSRFYPADIDLGTFRVESGKLTDLGSIAVFIDRQGEDYSYASVRATPNERGRRYLEAEFPHLAGSVSNFTAPLGWQPDGRDLDRRRDYLRATNRQIVYGPPFIQADGSVAYPSHLGMAIIRDGGGNWRLEAFDEDVELRVLTELDGQTVIVTEFSDIYYRSDSGSEWLEADRVPSMDPVVFLGSDEAVGFYAVTKNEKGIEIWASPGFHARWHRLNALKPKVGLLQILDDPTLGVDQNLPGSLFFDGDGSLFLLLRGWLYRYDFTENSFVDMKTPRVDSLQERNGVLTLRSDYLFGSNLVSFDGGVSWQPYKGRIAGMTEGQTRSVRITGHPVFTAGRNGYAIEKGRKRAKGDEPTRLIRTDDGGQTWVAVEGELPEGCLDLENLNDDGLLLRCFLSGEFYHTTDGGRTWELERSVSDT